MNIQSRTMSGFPLSIGTGMAMETLFDAKQAFYDPDRQIPDRPDMSVLTQAWINLSTLFRNMVGSMSSVDAQSSSVEDYYEALKIEIEVIKSLFKESYPHIKVTVYTNDYSKLQNSIKYNKVLVRRDNTPMKKEYADKLKAVTDKLTSNDETILKFVSTLKPSIKGKTIILTHQPFDLVTSQRFGFGIESLILLESHTGVVKKITQWNSKYYPVGDRDMSHLPFFSLLLFCFGDRSLILPGPMDLRKLLLDISEKRRWTPVTTLDKVKFDISNDVKEHFVRDFLLKLPTPT